MAIQHNLDKTKSFGTVVGGGGSMFAQNGILFNTHGVRISELTAEEIKAEEAEKAAAEAYQKAIEANDNAKVAIATADSKKAEEMAKLAGPEPINPEMPDFANWTKADMINLARNKKNVEISPQKTWAAVRTQLEGLY